MCSSWPRGVWPGPPAPMPRWQRASMWRAAASCTPPSPPRSASLRRRSTAFSARQRSAEPEQFCSQAAGANSPNPPILGWYPRCTSKLAMSLDSSRAFWDAKAAENPYWYVSSYGAYAERDLAEFWQAGRRIWQDLRDTIGYTPRHSDVAIEVGCGIGRLTRAIAADVAHVHAFDISEGMLALARLAGPVNATFHQSHGDSLAGMPRARPTSRSPTASSSICRRWPCSRAT